MMKSEFLFAAAAITAAFAVSSASAAISTSPSWSGSPQTTSAIYLFSTSSTTAAPESKTNPYGSPVLQVSTGPFSSGWQDPNGVDTLTRAGHGAWDLGGVGIEPVPSGEISITVPIASDAALKLVDLYIYVIWYQSPVSETSYSVAGLTPTSSSFQRELLALDGAGSWMNTSWTASFANLSQTSLELEMRSPANGSVVSEVHVYSRYTVIPEPTVTALVGLSAGLLFRRKRTC